MSLTYRKAAEADLPFIVKLLTDDAVRASLSAFGVGS